MSNESSNAPKSIDMNKTAPVQKSARQWIVVHWRTSLTVVAAVLSCTASAILIYKNALSPQAVVSSAPAQSSAPVNNGASVPSNTPLVGQGRLKERLSEMTTEQRAQLKEQLKAARQERLKQVEPAVLPSQQPSR